MAVHKDPGDIRPDEVQEIYPFGERCVNKRGHEAHTWELTTPDGYLTLECQGHTFCGKSGSVDSEGHRFATVCTSKLDHEGDCLDDIWGNFTPSD